MIEYASRLGATQGSLLDGAPAPSFGALAASVRRTELAYGAWIDHRPGWLRGADALLDEIARAVPWHAQRRHMYGREVAVPRLTKFYETGETLPHPILVEARERLSGYYAGELGEPLTTAGLCLYRDGNDSVAWHGDIIGRARHEDTVVAIVSFGAPRTLALRPRGGGPGQRFALGHGDLLAMGGSCQRTWEHAVPKTRAAVGPRLSVQFRPEGVR